MHLVGLDPATGITKWTSGNDLAGYPYLRFATGSDKCYYLHPSVNKIVCVNITNGQVLWDNLLLSSSSSVMFANNEIVQFGGNALILRDPLNGDVREHVSLPDDISSITLHINGMTYYDTYHGNYR